MYECVLKNIHCNFTLYTCLGFTYELTAMLKMNSLSHALSNTYAKFSVYINTKTHMHGNYELKWATQEGFLLSY